MNNFYVYTYSEPDNPEPFYVGKGSGNRATCHLSPSVLNQRNHFHHKLNKMISGGIRPVIKFVKVNLTELEALSLEIELITKYGRIDSGTGCLCNHTDGGDGQPGCQGGSGREYSFESRIKMSVTQSNRPKETNDKISKTNTERIGRKVCSIDVLTGKIIRIFDSLHAVKKNGFSPSSVSNVLSGRRQSHGGYFWRDYQGASNGSD